MFQEMSLLIFHHLGKLTCKFSGENNRRKDKETKKKKEENLNTFQEMKLSNKLPDIWKKLHIF